MSGWTKQNGTSWRPRLSTYPNSRATPCCSWTPTYTGQSLCTFPAHTLHMSSVNVCLLIYKVLFDAFCAWCTEILIKGWHTVDHWKITAFKNPSWFVYNLLFFYYKCVIFPDPLAGKPISTVCSWFLWPLPPARVMCPIVCLDGEVAHTQSNSPRRIGAHSYLPILVKCQFSDPWLISQVFFCPCNLVCY